MWTFYFLHSHRGEKYFSSVLDGGDPYSSVLDGGGP